MQDLNDVLIFSRVVDVGSFTGAANAMGIPKSTVSRRIARLEDHLGVRLLQRTTRKLSLTDAGRLYYDRSARIVAELEDAERVVTEMQEVPRGRLRVTAPVEVGDRIWSLLLLFLDAHPEVQMDLDLTNRYVNLVEEGYDVALRGGTLSDSSLIARKLTTASILLVASPQYLERRGVPETPEDLRDHECVLFANKGEQATWSLQGDNGPVHVRVKGRFAANHMALIHKAAVDGFGIALMPAMFVEHALELGHLVEVLPGAGYKGTGMNIVYPSTRHLAPKVRAFVDFLLEHFDDEILSTPSGCKHKGPALHRSIPQ